jgi:hypothetical protein
MEVAANMRRSTIFFSTMGDREHFPSPLADAIVTTRLWQEYF